MNATMYAISADNLNEIISIADDYMNRNGMHEVSELFDNADFHKYVNECMPISYEVSEHEKLTRFDNVRKVN